MMTHKKRPKGYKGKMDARPKPALAKTIQLPRKVEEEVRRYMACRHVGKYYEINSVPFMSDVIEFTSSREVAACVLAFYDGWAAAKGGG